MEALAKNTDVQQAVQNLEWQLDPIAQCEAHPRHTHHYVGT